MWDCVAAHLARMFRFFEVLIRLPGRSFAKAPYINECGAALPPSEVTVLANDQTLLKEIVYRSRIEL